MRAATDPTEARRLLELGAQVFAAAKDRDVSRADVVTALPKAWYPESSWRDDLAWAAAELALAGQALDDPRTAGWLDAGTLLALGHLEYEAGAASLDVYDTSAIAFADLVRALRASSHGTDVNEPLLLDGLRAILAAATTRAAADPFGAAVDQTEYDAVSDAFGLVAVARMYRELAGDGSFEGLGATQLGWALGANAWGVSFVVGVGTTYPGCPHHMIGNLATTADGAPIVLRGAVVNGPNAASLFEHGLGAPMDGMRPCPAKGRDGYREFTGHGSRFVDDVRAWQTVEPAIDMAATATLALALSR
ncbi:MAG: glycoside hydrolase family 9 protein [Chloroflexota bacterium]